MKWCHLFLLPCLKIAPLTRQGLRAHFFVGNGKWGKSLKCKNWNVQKRALILLSAGKRCETFKFELYTWMFCLKAALFYLVTNLVWSCRVLIYISETAVCNEEKYELRALKIGTTRRVVPICISCDIRISLLIFAFNAAIPQQHDSYFKAFLAIYHCTKHTPKYLLLNKGL